MTADEKWYGHICCTWAPWNDTCPGCNPPRPVPFMELCNELHALIKKHGPCPEHDDNPLCARLATELLRSGWSKEGLRPMKATELLDEF